MKVRQLNDLNLRKNKNLNKFFFNFKHIILKLKHKSFLLKKVFSFFMYFLKIFLIFTLFSHFLKFFPLFKDYYCLKILISYFEFYQEFAYLQYQDHLSNP
jgi:hypothetical protein